MQADLASWRPGPRGYALVLCTGFWDRDVFVRAAGAVLPGGLLAWEAFTEDALRDRPGMPARWCLGPAEPASLLPDDFTVLEQADQPATAKRAFLARRCAAPAPPPAGPLGLPGRGPALKDLSPGRRRLRPKSAASMSTTTGAWSEGPSPSAPPGRRRRSDPIGDGAGVDRSIRIPMFLWNMPAR